MIKLFEQWLVEEESSTLEKPELNKSQDSYKLSIKADGKSFEVEGVSDKEFTNSAAVSFTVDSSTNPNVKDGAVIMISPKPDEDGDFDIVVVNDQSKPEEALVYSGKVTKSAISV